MKRRFTLVLVAVLAAVAVGVPFLKADRLAQPMSRALENQLGRRVEINGPVRFNALARGLSLEQVVIHEDPQAGVEPFAYVAELQVTPSILGLLRGKLEISRLRLIEPSVNLAKSPHGGWNIQPALDRTLSGNRQSLPELVLAGARINFRIGEWKSAYYLGDAELRIESNGQTDWSVYFEGEPARTDRGLRGIGRLSGRGTVRMQSGRPALLDLGVSLTRTSIAEMLMLVQGRGTGLGGFFSARGKISGPLDQLGLSGRAQLEEFERWNWLLGNAAGPGLDFDGVLDLNGQRLDLRTAAPPDGLPVSARLRGFDLMGTPRWAALATVKNAPAESVQTLASELGFGIPGDMKWSGNLSGGLSYRSGHGWMGEVALAPGVVESPVLGRLESEDMRIRISQGLLALTQTSLRSNNAETLRLEGELNPQNGSGNFRLQSTEIPLTRLRAVLSVFGDPRTLGIPATNPGARWRGTVRYSRDANGEPQWQADGELRNAIVAIPGLTGRLELTSAEVAANPPFLQLRSFQGSLGSVKLAGRYRSPTRRGLPHQLSLTIRELAAGELERVLQPALRRERGFLSRTLALGGEEVPDWMRERHLDGDVLIQNLLVAGDSMGSMKFHFKWDGASIDLVDLFAFEDRLRGRLQIALRASEPVYTGTVNVSGVRWMGGTLHAEGAVGSAGTGAALVEALSVKGRFWANDVELRPGDSWAEFSGEFGLERERDAWKWLVSNVRVQNGDERLTGQGASLADGRIGLELSSPGKAIRLAGRLTGAAWENLR